MTNPIDPKLMEKAKKIVFLYEKSDMMTHNDLAKEIALALQQHGDERYQEGLLSHQKGVDGLVEALKHAHKNCHGCGSLKVMENALSHYQSLSKAKGPDAEHRPLNGGSPNEKV